ncbi:MAG: DNA polymerase I [Chloroflexota bacterium]|nr:DNA polymerase I [Chloroflexota bacterium]
MPRGKLVLIDGHALAYRAYHALPPDLSTSKGELTNAVFGFTSMLLKVLSEEEPDYIAVAFDVGKTFRHEEYKPYKAHRAKMPEDLAGQLERIHQVVETLGIPILEVEGYEGDDVLGTLAAQARERGVGVLIVTGDTDTFQLVDENTKVLTSRRRFSDTVVYDEAAIGARYGLKPEQLVDFKALVGDKTDNIPGVKGVGKKTAAELLRRYGTLEEIYAHLDEVESTRFRNALEKGRGDAFLSKHLVTIVRDAPVKFDLEACRVGKFDRKKVMGLFRELEFRTLVSRLPSSERQRPPQQPSMFEGGRQTVLGDYSAVTDEDALDELVAKLSSAKGLAFDTETTSTDPMDAELVGISLAAREGEAYYIPVGHEGGPQLPRELVLGKLRPILEDASIPKYGHNSKYDFTVLAHYGVRVGGLAFDTMIAEWLINPASKNLGLKNLAWARLGVEMTPITDLIGKGKGQITMAQVPIGEAAPYACADADMTYHLVRVLEPKLRGKELWPLFTQVEMPLVPVLSEMEMRGVKLSVDYLKEMSEGLQGRLAELELEIQDMVGHPFNINSTQQLSGVLFVELGLPAQGVPKTKAGFYSTAAGVLEKLRGKHPIIDLILEYRELAKLKSTYVDTLPELVNERRGRVHTSYNQTGTVTGRISSSDPNLQNIPIRTELGRQVRRAFIAAPGHLLLSSDYSQVELRIMAHISQDEGLLAAFRRGEDIHASTAAAVLDVPIEAVTPEMRRLAKTVNFGLSYGMSGYGLAQRTGLSQEEANAFIKNYFAKYPKVKKYVEETKRRAHKQGYVETLLGRRRYFPELTSEKAHWSVKRAAEREAINMPIQGTAADILKIAIINLHRAIHERELRSRMILQVHDELVLEVPEEEMEVVKLLVKSTMEGAFKLDAPLKVDMKVGKNWLEME